MTGSVSTLLDGHGFSVRPPAGWEGRIYRRNPPTAPDTPQNRASAVGATGWLGEQTLPVVHLADFAMPATRGDYGSGAVESMRDTNTFVALLEFGSECLGSALYRDNGIPWVRPDRFKPYGLQRIIPGQTGAQYFFTDNGRPLCLYVVLGSSRDLMGMTARVNEVLAGVTVNAR